MEPLTATAIATLLLTKMVEKLGESLGEKIPDLGSKVWEQVTRLKGLLKAKSPETAAVLDAAEAAPVLMESQPEVFGLPALTQKVEALATTDTSLAEVIDAIAIEVRPQLPAAFQEKVMQQVMLKGIKTSKTITVGDVSQVSSPDATRTTQEMLVDIETEGDLNVRNANQKA